jgi:hypothetical protein
MRLVAAGGLGAAVAAAAAVILGDYPLSGAVPWLAAVVFRIATGWGLDPVPRAAWTAIAIGLVWPIGWAALSRRARRPAAAP